MAVNILDFAMVIESVHRRSLWKIFRANGIPSHVIKVQRKNPLGIPWFVPLTHFAGLVVLLGFFEAFKKDLRTSPKNRML